MKNDSDGTGKKDKKINRIKDQLAKLREKLKASEDQQSPIPSKNKPKKIVREAHMAYKQFLESNDSVRHSNISLGFVLQGYDPVDVTVVNADNEAGAGLAITVSDNSDIQYDQR